MSDLTKGSVEITSKLLGLDPASLTQALTNKKMKSAGEDQEIMLVSMY